MELKRIDYVNDKFLPQGLNWKDGKYYPFAEGGKIITFETYNEAEEYLNQCSWKCGKSLKDFQFPPQIKRVLNFCKAVVNM